MDRLGVEGELPTILLDGFVEATPFGVRVGEESGDASVVGCDLTRLGQERLRAREIALKERDLPERREDLLLERRRLDEGTGGLVVPTGVVQFAERSIGVAEGDESFHQRRVGAIGVLKLRDGVPIAIETLRQLDAPLIVGYRFGAVGERRRNPHRPQDDDTPPHSKEPFHHAAHLSYRERIARCAVGQRRTDALVISSLRLLQQTERRRSVCM